MRTKIPLLERYGRLKVLSDERNWIRGKAFTPVQCDCGTEKLVSVSDLRKGKINSCGCLRREYVANKNTTHGLSSHPLYGVWTNMKFRCCDESSNDYHNYGGRGITICAEWIYDFKSFHDWAIHNGYKNGLEIDRIDNDGNYEPSNCEFVTKKENTQKTRKVKLIPLEVVEIRTLYGAGLMPKPLSEIYGVSKCTINSIVSRKTWTNY